LSHTRTLLLPAAWHRSKGTVVTDTVQPGLDRTIDNQWRDRARDVLPGGMYGHIHARDYPANYPQFFGRSDGSRIWDVDGNAYIDMMCSWGPMIVGYRNERVDAAYARELEQRDLAYGPSPRVVELADRFVEMIDHADWAMFGKNGGDATTLAVTIARAETGRRKILKARKAYHGSTPWFTPGSAGITPEDRANVIEFTYNDVASLTAAVAEAGDDLAGIVVTPHRHEVHADQEPVDLAFAQATRRLCDANGGVLILDDVRAGFRTSLAGSWAPLGIRPDLSAYSKCIANGYPLSAVTGIAALNEAAASIYATGSFWYASGPMAAGLECLALLEELDGPALMGARGARWMDGMREQATAHGIDAVISGPPTMPYIRFVDGEPMELAFAFCEEALRRGVLLHPFHNMFLSTAHSEEDVDLMLEATDAAFAHLAARS
jgi:glutamate-1-semialdehyde 2,1-aminomutase